MTYPNGVNIKVTPDGSNIWQGDILLTNEQVGILSKPSTRGALLLSRPWPNGIIYYEWGTISDFSKTNAKNAMEHIW